MAPRQPHPSGHVCSGQKRTGSALSDAAEGPQHIPPSHASFYLSGFGFIFSSANVASIKFEWA
jgi:hypothetical protein